MHGNITTYYRRGIRTNFRRHGREYRIPETTSYPPVTWLFAEFPYYTPPKTNMEPENEPLEEEIPMENHHF